MNGNPSFTVVPVFIVWQILCSAAGASNWPWSRPPKQAEKPHPAVARVFVDEADGVSQGSGTLVDVRDHAGLVVTNWHVVRGARGPIFVVFPDGFRSAARVLRVDEDWDLAALMIWRPSIEPVRLAGRIPRPGDRLTIAGYGPGEYRAVSGKCSQYLAPGSQHPYEMVEVEAAARQGDSGGPMFNEAGELAGVLFGSVGGTTSGSHSGRVSQFLSSAWPPVQNDDSGASPASGAERVATGARTDGRDAPGTAAVVEPPVESAPPARGSVDLAPLPTWSLAPSQAVPPRGDVDSGLVDDAPHAERTSGRWSPLTGNTLFEQVKSVFALIGLLAVGLQFLRWLSPQS